MPMVPGYMGGCRGSGESVSGDRGMSNLEIWEMLARPFPVDKIHWRVGAMTQDKKKGIALAYVDARDVMMRLDDVMGPANWQDRYPWSDGGRLVCEIGLRIGGEWLWKSNGAGETQVEAEKGAFSDAFKRAGVMWGIARYLYALPNVWVPIENRRIVSPPALPLWATPLLYDYAAQIKGIKRGWAVYMDPYLPGADFYGETEEAVQEGGLKEAAQYMAQIPSKDLSVLKVAPSKGGPWDEDEYKMFSNQAFRKAYAKAVRSK